MSNIIYRLGLGKERTATISSICLVVIVFFYFFVLGSYLQTSTYTFRYRVTYQIDFDSHITNLNVDTFIILLATIVWSYVSIKTGYTRIITIIFFSVFLVLLFSNFVAVAHAGALFSLPVIICMIILARIQNSRLLTHDLKLSIHYITIMSIGLALCGILGLLLFTITGKQQDSLEKYPYAIFQQLLSILTTSIMVILAFCVPLKVILNRYISKVKKFAFQAEIFQQNFGTRRLVVYLSLCVLLGISLALLPHISIINPNNSRLGVDTPMYVQALKLMKSEQIDSVFRNITSGDRPLTLIVLFGITELSKGDPARVIEYSPVFLTPLLVIGMFILTRQLTSNDSIAILAAFLSAISFQTLIGIYSGFYGNWLAIILGYLAFALIIRYLKKPSKIILASLAVVMTGVLLAHVYTWSIVISVAYVFLFVLHVLHYYPRKQFILLYLILASSIAVDVLKSSLTGSSTGLEADVSIGFSQGLGISQFSDRLRTLADTVFTYYGGVYANVAILGLAMYWLIRCKMRELSSVFMLIFLSTALVPLYIGDWVILSRVLYNIPFQIPAAISLYFLWKGNHKFIFVAIILIAGYLSFHVLANLGYVSPSNPLNIIQE
jgi:hypothetical protein